MAETGARLPVLTRRTLLASAAAGTATAAVGPEPPTVTGNAELVTIRLGLLPPWILRRTDFGPAAVLSHRIDADGVRISVADGTLPGSPPFRLDLLLAPGPAAWEARAAWAGPLLGAEHLGRAVPLAAVLEGLPLSVSLLRAAREAVFARRLGAVLEAPERLELRLGTDGAITVAPAGGGPGRFEALDGSLRTRTLRLNPAPGTGEPILARLQEPAFRPMRLGALGPARVELAARSAVEAEIRVPAPGGTPNVTLWGSLELRVVAGEIAEGPVRITRAAITGEGRPGGATLHAALQPDPNEHALSLRCGEFVARGLEPAVVSAVAGRIERFEVVLALSNYGISLPGADLARLDFDAARLELRLPGLEEPGRPGVPKRPRADCRAHLGGLPPEPEAPLTLQLDAARLHLASTPSLLSLRVAFRGLALLVDARGIPSLETWPASGTAGTGGPHLAFELPPQHVLEQAFFRQPADLPDAGAPLTAEDLRALRGEPAAAQKRRDEIHSHKRKKSEEEARPTAGGKKENRFVDFADRWKEKASPSWGKPWIGPAGLFSPEARRAARALAQEIALGRLQDATLADLLPPLGLEESVVSDAEARHARDADALVDAVLREAERRFPHHALLQNTYRPWRAGRAAAEREKLPLRFATAAWPMRPPRPGETKERPFLSEGRLVLDDGQATAFLAELRKALREELDSSSGPESFRRPALARLAGVTRLVFRPRRATLPFDLRSFTDWSGLDLQVTRRAERLLRDTKDGPEPEGDLARILAHQGFAPRPHGLAAERMAEIHASVDQPSALETAIELPARLVLSPAQDARWRLSPLRPKEDGPVALWQAELVEARARPPSLRAVWSPDFRGPALLGDAPPPPGPWAPWAIPPDGTQPTERFRTSLDAADRHELVALSSVHALPVLARVDSEGMLDGSQAAAPPGYHLADLLRRDPVRDRDAIYLPRPLEARLLTLSALGGTLDVEANFVPPASARHRDGRNLFDAFAVSRWRSRIALGRDISTEVLRKGFMFPTGQTACLVRATERRFFADPPPGKGIVAFLIQRLYIEVTRTEQREPLEGQPNAGRGSPFRHSRILTRRTPDLLDPASEPAADGEARDWPNGRVTGTGMRGLVFWPRVSPGPAGEVRFSATIDGRPQAVGLPLIFCDNLAVHDEGTMQALVQYWERLAEKEPARCTIFHGGAPRTYAEEREEGDCTFETESWLIGAEGRRDSDNVSYRMDSILEGADQPPFYAKLIRATCRIRQIERLTGNGAEPVQVKYDPAYVAHGFGEPSQTYEGLGEEAFLQLLSPTWLDPGRNGDRTGAVARTKTRITHVNRGGGPVNLHVPRTPQQTPQPAAVTPQPRPNPLEFFDPDAKLLGLVKLNDLLKLAGTKAVPPVLKETVDYAGDALRATAGRLRALLGRIEPAMAEAGLDPDLAGTLYPALLQAKRNLDAALLEVEGTAGTDDAAALARQAAAAGRAVASGRALLAELERTGRAPAAPIAALLQEEVGALTAEFRKLLDLTVFEGDPVACLRAAAARQLAEALRSNPGWRRLVAVLPPVPGLPAGQAEAAEQALVAALMAEATWLAADPVEEIAAAVRRAAPGYAEALATREGRERLLQAGIRPFMDALRKGAEEPLARLVALVERWAGALAPFAKLSAVKETACREGAAALRDLVAAALPPEDLFACPVRGGPPPAAPTLCAGLLELVRAVRALPGALREHVADPDPVKRAVALAAEAWAKCQLAPPGQCLPQTIEQVATALAEGLLAIREARREVAAWLAGTADGCADLSALPTAAILRLGMARSAVLEAALAWPAALGDPRLPAGPEPPPVEALREQLAAVTEKLFGLARDLTLLRQEGAAALGRARAALAALQERLGLASLAEAMAQLDRATEAAKALAEDIEAVAGATSLDGIAAAAQAAVEAEAEGHLRALRDAAAAAEGTLMRVAADAAHAAALPTFEAASEFAREAASVVHRLYTEMVRARDGALTVIARRNAFLEQVLGPPPQGACATEGWAGALLLLPTGKADTPCTARQDGLTQELEEAAALNARPDLAAVAGLMARWRDRQSAPQRLAANVERVAQLGVQAVVTRLLNLDALRAALAEELARIVPLRTTLTYDLAVPLDDYPPEPESGAVLRFAVTGQGEQRNLVLKSRVEAELMPGGPAGLLRSSPQVSARAEGRLGPFEVTLFDALRLKFGGVAYEGGTGRRGALDVKFDPQNGVAFAGKLSFLTDLKGAFRFSGSGVEVVPRTGGPGIEVRYGLALPDFGMGALAFLNIDFVTSCTLPFDAKPALIRCGLNTIEKPFLISGGGWGGGGHFQMEAAGGEFRAFTASFEYGGVTGINFGILKGQGRVTTGVHVRMVAKEGCELGGLFFAGYTGHVASFAMASTFTLRLTKPSNGSGINGEATLTYTFPFFPRDLEFKVKVWKQQEDGFRSAALRETAPRVMLADSRPVPPALLAAAAQARATSLGVSPALDWREYRAYFDETLEAVA